MGLSSRLPRVPLNLLIVLVVLKLQLTRTRVTLKLSPKRGDAYAKSKFGSQFKKNGTFQQASNITYELVNLFSVPKLKLIRMRVHNMSVAKRKACKFLVQSLPKTRLSSKLPRFVSLNLSIILSMPKLQLTRTRVKLKVSPKKGDGYSELNFGSKFWKKRIFQKGFEHQNVVFMSINTLRIMGVSVWSPIMI